MRSYYIKSSSKVLRLGGIVLKRGPYLVACIAIAFASCRGPTSEASATQRAVSVAAAAVLVEVARIVGMTNIQPGRIDQTVDDFSRIRVGQVHLFAASPVPAADEVFVCIRPEDIAIQRGAADHGTARNQGVLRKRSLATPSARCSMNTSRNTSEPGLVSSTIEAACEPARRRRP